jgi:lipopolysaccharide transport system permease protein
MEHTPQREHWDVTIGPAEPWWRLNLRELWQGRDLLALLIRRDLLAVYKQSVLGPLWQILQPVLMAIMFSVVFGLLARVQGTAVPPLLFYLSGVIPWTLFSNVVSRTSQTLVWNAHLMSKIHFPRLLAPMATTLSTAVSFLVQMVTYFIIAAIYQINGGLATGYGSSILLLPLLVVLMLCMAFGSGILVAALTTKYRDLSFLLAFGLQLLLYMSPVIFPMSMVPAGSPLKWLILFNPMTGIIEGFRSALFGTPLQAALLVHSTIAASVAMVLGLAVFQRVQRSFTDVI